MRREPGRGDDDVGSVSRHGVGDALQRAVMQRDADDRQEPHVFGIRSLCGHEDVSAEFGEGVGHRETSDRESEDHDAEAAPVGVPARQIVQARGHTAASQAT